VCFPLTVDDRATRFTVYRRKECYSLRAGILVWNFTFHTRNSKPESLLRRTSTLGDHYTYLTLFETCGQHTDQKMRGVFLRCTFLLVVGDKFNWTSSHVDEKRTKACEQVIWFGIPRLTREIPSQIMCSLG